MTATQQKYYDRGTEGSVYVLHIKYPDGKVDHYIGYCTQTPPTRRVEEQLKGKGAQHTRRALKAKAKITLAHYWPNVHIRFESYLHALRNTIDWCPIENNNRAPLPSPSDLPADVDPNWFGRQQRSNGYGRLQS